MIRKLGLLAMVCAVVCAMTTTSEARARGRSFKVVSTDGTNAGIAFDWVAKVTVHTPGGDVEGLYNETPPLKLLGISTVNGFSFNNGYAGSFTGTVLDLSLLQMPVYIVGTGVGTTGAYAFYGTAKN